MISVFQPKISFLNIFIFLSGKTSEHQELFNQIEFETEFKTLNECIGVMK